MADIFRFLQYCNLIILECSGKILDQAEHQAVCGEAWAWQHQQREHCQDFLQNRSKDDCIYFENRLWDCDSLCRPTGHVQWSKQKTLLWHVLQKGKETVWHAHLPSSGHGSYEPECAQVSVPWACFHQELWAAHWSPVRKCTKVQ